MFLPFSVALLTVFSVITGKKKTSLGLWLLLLIVAAMSFNHHTADQLNLSF